jgi:hypothetical protein
VDPSVYNYHIRLTSSARDAGFSAVIATEDIDGDPRLIGSAIDIGADELNPTFLYLPLINR